MTRAYTNSAGALIDQDMVDRFHEAYYHAGTTWGDTQWKGIPVLKTPLDLWNYQEILHACRPDFVVETGTAEGGSAVFLADMMDLLGIDGRVVTIDNAGRPRPPHPRVEYVCASSVDPAVVSDMANGSVGKTTMVILDSDHSVGHVSAEIAAYHGLVTPGQFLIVEDTNVNGHPVVPGYGSGGPWEAVEAFMTGRTDFAYDDRDRKFLMSFNPRGYLRRVAP